MPPGQTVDCGEVWPDLGVRGRGVAAPGLAQKPPHSDDRWSGPIWLSPCPETSQQ